MFLRDDEIQALEKIGMTVKEGRITLIDEEHPNSDLHYCGFNLYASIDGRVFEKQADASMAEIISEEIKAEQRFIRTHQSLD